MTTWAEEARHQRIREYLEAEYPDYRVSDIREIVSSAYERPRHDTPFVLSRLDVRYEVAAVCVVGGGWGIRCKVVLDSEERFHVLDVFHYLPV